MSFAAENVRMEIRMDLAQIVISDTRDSQLIVLRERDGSRHLPIMIGLGEANAIQRRRGALQPVALRTSRARAMDGRRFRT